MKRTSPLIRSISPYYFERARDRLIGTGGKMDYPEYTVIKIHEDERFVYYIYKDTSRYDAYNGGWMELGFQKDNQKVSNVIQVRL